MAYFVNFWGNFQQMHQSELSVLSSRNHILGKKTSLSWNSNNRKRAFPWDHHCALVCSRSCIMHTPTSSCRIWKTFWTQKSRFTKIITFPSSRIFLRNWSCFNYKWVAVKKTVTMITFWCRCFDSHEVTSRPIHHYFFTSVQTSTYWKRHIMSTNC